MMNYDIGSVGSKFSPMVSKELNKTFLRGVINWYDILDPRI